MRLGRMAVSAHLTADEALRIVPASLGCLLEACARDRQESDPKLTDPNFGAHSATENGIIPSELSPSRIDLTDQWST